MRKNKITLAEGKKREAFLLELKKIEENYKNNGGLSLEKIKCKYPI